MFTLTKNNENIRRTNDNPFDRTVYRVTRKKRRREREKEGDSVAAINFCQRERLEFQTDRATETAKASNKANGQQVSLRGETRRVTSLPLPGRFRETGVRFIWFAMRNRQEVACNEKVDADVVHRVSQETLVSWEIEEKDLSVYQVV